MTPSGANLVHWGIMWIFLIFEGNKISQVMVMVPGSEYSVIANTPEDAMQEWIDVYGDDEAEMLKFYNIEPLQLRVDIVPKIVPIK